MPTRIEINCETGEVQEIELTAKEIADLEEAQAKAEADRVDAENKAKAQAEAKAALLDKLGITEEEAKLLLA